jgi:murein L,D-transpeptidase YcbB/YkuD
LRLEYRSDGTPRLWQPPGDGNALGRIRFNLPNRFLVYQHDTPNPEMFDRVTRLGSHGCIRVENAIYYAQALLAIARPGEEYSVQELWRFIGDEQTELSFSRTIPVHVTYQTAFADDQGRLALREDIYRHDVAINVAIDLDARGRDAQRLKRAEALRPATPARRSFAERVANWSERQAKQILSALFPP